MEVELSPQSLSELSAFVASARKEGFSFKPSQIVRDAQYCSTLIETLAERGSESLSASALRIISKYHRLNPLNIES